jgi:YD repeat-containing protein
LVHGRKVGDALGNRTNVVATDGSSIAYTDNALSRLTAETHKNADVCL